MRPVFTFAAEEAAWKFPEPPPAHAAGFMAGGFRGIGICYDGFALEAGVLRGARNGRFGGLENEAVSL